MGRTIVVLGAESTGKTTLVGELAQALVAEGLSVTVVDEYLREFCDRAGRTPQAHEQAAIADEQMRRIDAATVSVDVLVADTDALMVAVYSDHIFGDTSLYESALAHLRRCDLVLLTAVDLPWQADGFIRDGDHVRAPVDAKVRAALLRGGIGFSVVSGTGPLRLERALAASRHTLGLSRDDADDGKYARWAWNCERCGDADCERHVRKG